MEDSNESSKAGHPAALPNTNSDIFSEEDYAELAAEFAAERARASLGKPKAYSASYWLTQPVVPSEPILEGLFDKGDKVMIIGKSKTRKSFFALQLAFCIAGQRKFLTQNTYKKKVLMVQFEIKENNYHARCKMMAEKLIVDIEHLDNLVIVNARGATSNSQELQELLISYVNDIKPEVIFLDPLYKILDGDESKIEDVKPTLKFFDSLAEKKDAAIIVIHHDKKGHAGDQDTTDRGSGSGIFGRDADCGITLTEHKDQDDVIVIEAYIRNHPKFKPICAEWSDYRFLVSGASPDKKTSRTNNKTKIKHQAKVDIALEVITKQRLFKSSLGVSLFNSELMDAGISKNDLTAVKESLIEMGMIEIRATGKGAKGQDCKTVFFLDAQAVSSRVPDREILYDEDDVLF